MKQNEIAWKITKQIWNLKKNRANEVKSLESWSDLETSPKFQEEFERLRKINSFSGKQNRNLKDSSGEEGYKL